MATRFPGAAEAHLAPNGRIRAALVGGLALLAVAGGGLLAWQLGWLGPREAAIDYSVPIDDPTGAKAQMAFTIAAVTPTNIALRVANVGTNAARLSHTALRYMIWEKQDQELRIFGLDLRPKENEGAAVILDAGEVRLVNFDFPGLLNDAAVPDNKTGGELVIITMRPPSKIQYQTKRIVNPAELRTYVEGHLMRSLLGTMSE